MKSLDMSNKIYEMIYANHLVSDSEVWCIGDVHGCNDQFVQLIENIKKESPNSIIIQTGDLIDRGPDLYDVFKTVKDYDIITTIGNHELNFIQEHFNYKKCRSNARMENHIKLEKLTPDKRMFVIDSMLSMKNYLTVQTSSGIWFVSHAPFMKEINEELDCGNASNYCMSNTPYYEDGSIVKCVHGHLHWNYTCIKEQLLTNKNECYNIDSGAVYEGGYLTALELTSKKVLTVKGPN